jgi:hypothetical protein
MIYLPTRQDVRDTAQQLADDSNVGSVAMFHFHPNKIINRAIHDGHKFCISKMREKFDVVIGCVMASPGQMPSHWYPEGQPDIEPYAQQPFVYYPATSNKLDPSQEDLDYVNTELGLDYFYSSEADADYVNKVWEHHQKMGFRPAINKAGFDTEQDSVVTDFFQRAMISYFVKRDICGPLSPKLNIVGSRKDTMGRMSLWKNWLRFTKNPQNIPGFPMNHVTMGEGTTPHWKPGNNWEAPLYRDADGLMPEYNEPPEIRTIRRDIHNILVGIDQQRQTLKDVEDALRTVPLPLTHTMFIFPGDYRSVRRYFTENPSGALDNSPIPQFGEIEIEIMDNITGELFEDYLFTGQDDTKWLDIRTLQEFD